MSVPLGHSPPPSVKKLDGIQPSMPDKTAPKTDTGSNLDPLTVRHNVDQSVDKQVKGTGTSVRLSDIPVKQGKAEKKPATATKHLEGVKNFFKTIAHFFGKTLPNSLFHVRKEAAKSEFDKWEAKPSKLPPSNKDFLEQALELRTSGGREPFHTFINREIAEARKTADENFKNGTFPIIWREVLSDRLKEEVLSCKSHSKMVERLGDAFVHLNFYEGTGKKDFLELRDLVSSMIDKYSDPEAATKRIKTELDETLTGYMASEVGKQGPFRESGPVMQMHSAIMMFGNDKMLEGMRDAIRSELPTSVPPSFLGKDMSEIRRDPAFKQMAFDLVKGMIGKCFDGTTERKALDIAVNMGVTSRAHVSEGLREIAKEYAGITNPKLPVEDVQKHFKASAFCLRMINPLLANDLAGEFKTKGPDDNGDEPVDRNALCRDLLVECSKIVQRGIALTDPESSFASTGLPEGSKADFIKFANDLRLTVENVASKC